MMSQLTRIIEMKNLITIGALLIIGSAQAQPICDFEHHCYNNPPPQIYHDLNGNVVPPPAPQYPPRSITVHSPTPQVTLNANVCKLAKIRVSPEAPQTIVEICTMSDEEERMYRERQSQLQASIPQFQPY
jgi:hypothetical protein